MMLSSTRAEWVTTIGMKY